MKVIEVYKKGTNELVAADKGESITVDSLKGKMLRKSIDITDSDLYEIEESVDYSQQEESLYKEMESEVKEKMIEVFGTDKSDSAVAFSLTIEAMDKRPDSFADSKSDLKSVGAVKSHAGSKMNEIDGYFKWRRERLEKFRKDKLSLRV